MEENRTSKKDVSLNVVFAALGIGLVGFSVGFRISPQGAPIADLLLNVGATLIATVVISLFYQRFGSENLLHQIEETRRSLVIAQHGLTLGIRDMWAQRRHVPRDEKEIMWNTFAGLAKTEFWLLGIAEEQYAVDVAFQRIVSDGTTHGCNYRFLLLDPDSDAVTEIDRREGKVQNRNKTRIHNSLSQFQLMQRQNANKRGTVAIRLYSSMPQVSIVRSDDELLVTPYNLPIHGDDSFTFQVQFVRNGIFNQYIKHFQDLWDSGKVPPTIEG